MQLHGLHHVTAVTGNAPANLDFYTRVLGLRLVKKTVNQDDVSAYHLFYADKLGSPGTDITFFDWPRTAPEQRGTDSIVNTMFRVNGRDALVYWEGRLKENGVAPGPIAEFRGALSLRFEDPEGQRLTLVDDGGAPFDGEVWDGSDIPAEYALRGFHGVVLSVPAAEQLGMILTRILNFEELDRRPTPNNALEEVIIYGMDGGGPGREVHVVVQPNESRGFLGRGGVHHVAFRLRDDAEQAAWLQHLNSVGMPNSGLVDRFWFKSLYFRVTNGILFELATDGPGFGIDEDPARLGEELVLPPFLEGRRAQIEAGLKPLSVV